MCHSQITLHARVTSNWFCVSKCQRPESKISCFWYNYTVTNCLLTTSVHNYFAQSIQYTHVSKYCEPLTEWSIHLTAFCPWSGCGQCVCVMCRVGGPTSGYRGSQGATRTRGTERQSCDQHCGRQEETTRVGG